MPRNSATADEQHRPHRGHQDDERRPELRAHHAVQQAVDGGPPVLLDRGILLGDGAGDAAHLRLRLLEADPWLEPRGRAQVVEVAHGVAGEGERHVAVAPAPIELARREHADDGVPLAIQDDLAAHQAGIPAELRSPGPLAEHEHVVVAELILARDEEAPQGRAHAEDVEVGRAHQVQPELAGLARGGRHGHDLAGLRGHGGEGRRLPLPVLEVQRRDAVARAAGRLLPELHQPFGLGIREGLEQHPIQEAEYRGVGPQAQPDGEDGHGREGGTLAQAANREADVGPEHAPETPRGEKWFPRSFPVLWGG